MPKVSVIIPVYNTEKYLKDCVESVLHQSFRDFEIILVDDGSTDNSPILCDELCEKDTRIRVIHKRNEGLSMARNDGLAIAKGNYVLFLDSDDFWINRDDLDLLVKFANKKSQGEPFSYIEFNRSRYFPSSETFYNLPAFSNGLANMSKRESIIPCLVEQGLFPMSACTKLLNREFLITNGISFIKGLFSEDIPWFLDVLRHSNETPIYYLDRYMYGNRSEVSTSLTSTFSEKKYLDVLWIIEKESHKILSETWSEDERNALLSFLAYRYTILMAQASIYKNDISEGLLNKTKELAWILKYDSHPKVKKTNWIIRIFGRRIASSILGFYMKNKEKAKRMKSK